jgi:hypothetical protein
MLTCRPRARASEESSCDTDPLRASEGISGFSFDGTAEVRTADVRRTGTAEGKGAGAAAVLLTGTAGDSLTGAAEGRGAGTAAVLLAVTADDSLTGAADGHAVGADGQLLADESAAKSADR